MQAWGGDTHAVSRLQGRQTHNGTHVHPADLDDALCTGALIGWGEGGETRLPFAVDEAQLQRAPGKLTMAVRPQLAPLCMQPSFSPPGCAPLTAARPALHACVRVRCVNAHRPIRSLARRT